MEYELNLDPLVICRVCLAENTLKTLFCNEIVNGSILPFPKVFESVTGCKVTKNDGFPDKVCTGCRQTINESYILKQKCTSNQTLLSGILNIPICKNEERKRAITVSSSTQTCNDNVESVATQTTPTKSKKSYNLATQTEHALLVSITTQTLQTKTSSGHTQTPHVKHKTNYSQTKPVTYAAIHSQTDIILSEKCTIGWSGIVPQAIEDEATNEAPEEIPTSIQKPDEIKPANPSVDVATPKIQTTPIALQDDITVSKPVVIKNSNSDDENEDYYIIHMEEDEEDVKSLSEQQQQQDHVDLPTDAEEYKEFVIDENTAVEYLLDAYDCAVTEHASVDSSVEMEYKCVFCNRNFENQASCQQHLADCEIQFEEPPPKRRRNRSAKVSQEEIHICKLCKHRCKTSDDFIEHQELHKQTMPMLVDSTYYYRCGTCFSVFISINDLENHFDSIDTCTKSQMEELCTDYQFLVDDDEDVKDITNHIDCLPRLCSIVKTSENRLMCNWCMTFDASSAGDIFTHFTDSHFERGIDQTETNALLTDSRNTYCESFSTEHKCGYCKETFRWLRDAIPHVYSHSERFNCPFMNCTDFYTRFHLLSMHMNRKHLNEDKHICEHCNVDCNSYYNLRAHMRRECDARQFDCDRCDKRFYTSSNLMLHRKVHQQGRRFKCSFCDKRFTHSGDMKTHERIHTGDKPYACPMCDMSFRSIGNRKDHMATHNLDESTRVQCQICSQTFKSERILRGHMAIHAQVRRFKCQVCSKEFYRKYHLTKHILTHGGDAYPVEFLE